MKQTPQTIPQARRFYLAAAIVILVLGWSVRAHSSSMPPLIGAYAPDALWALMVFLLIAAAKPRSTTQNTAFLALVFAFGIEFSQLYQAPWINAIRATRLGSLVLGHGFLWSDLLCYSVGIGAGTLLHHWLSHKIRG